VESNYPLPLNGLRNFYWAAKLGSFKQAAEKLFVSEAAVSQQIRKLEAALDVKLFSRGHQRVKLTAQGEQFFPYIESAFKDIFRGVNRIIDDPAPNRLAITTMPSFASHWLISRLTDFYEKYPDISISMDTSIETRNFNEGEFDLAIRFGQGTYPGLHSELLMNEPIVLVCHRDLLNDEQVTRQDIMRLPFIRGTFEGVTKTMAGFMDYYQFSEDELSKLILMRDGGLGVEAARSGQGIALQRLSLVIDLVDSGQLVYAKDYAFRDYSFYAVAPEHHFQRNKVKLFLKWLKSEMQNTANKLKPHISAIKH